jgi:hypothetical protein
VLSSFSLVERYTRVDVVRMGIIKDGHFCSYFTNRGTKLNLPMGYAFKMSNIGNFRSVDAAMSGPCNSRNSL